jgi:hypothetical protein
MNERIRQLAEQCESFGSWDNKTYSFDKEKFAELIVKECIRLCDEVDLAGADDCIDKIKDNFGVD